MPFFFVFNHSFFQLNHPLLFIHHHSYSIKSFILSIKSFLHIRSLSFVFNQSIHFFPKLKHSYSNQINCIHIQENTLLSFHSKVKKSVMIQIKIMEIQSSYNTLKLGIQTCHKSPNKRKQRNLNPSLKLSLRACNMS